MGVGVVVHVCICAREERVIRAGGKERVRLHDTPVGCCTWRTYASALRCDGQGQEQTSITTTCVAFTCSLCRDRVLATLLCWMQQHFPGVVCVCNRAHSIRNSAATAISTLNLHLYSSNTVTVHCCFTCKPPEKGRWRGGKQMGMLGQQ